MAAQVAGSRTGAIPGGGPLLGRRYRNDGLPLLRLNPVQRSALASHLGKLTSGAYALEHADCPICGPGEDDLLSEKDRYGIPMRVVICRSCGLIRTTPRLTPEAFADFYNTDYRALYGGHAAPTPEFFRNQAEHGEAIASFVEPHLGRPISESLVIESGCGAGGILHAFREAGATVLGCDLGAAYLEYGRSRHGLDLRAGSLSDLELPRPADLVIYSHVLEHIPDVRDELRRIRSLLAPGGLLYVEVPSARHIRRAYRGDFLRLLQNAHTFHFTLRSLRNLLLAEGFECLQGDETVRAVFRASETAAAEPIRNDYEDMLAFLRRAERLRPVNQLLHALWIRSTRRLLVRAADGLGLRRLVRRPRRAPVTLPRPGRTQVS